MHFGVLDKNAVGRWLAGNQGGLPPGNWKSAIYVLEYLRYGTVPVVLARRYAQMCPQAATGEP